MKKNIVTVIAFSILITNAFCQDSTVAKLTFKDAVKIGLQNNVLLNQQKNQLAYTQVNKTASLLQLAPSIDASANAYRNDGNSFNPNEGKVVNGKTDYINASIECQHSGFHRIERHQYLPAGEQYE